MTENGWKHAWNWKTCPVWFIHTGLDIHLWKKDALCELFRLGLFWGEKIIDAPQFHEEWNNTFGGQLWSACIGNSEPYWSLFCNYSKLPLGTHPMEYYLNRKAIRNAGAWGYLETWIAIIKSSIQNKFPTTWIFDDDVRPHQTFKRSSYLFTQIEKNCPRWKIILWGASQQNWSRVNFSKKWYMPNNTTDGSFAVMINSSVYDLLLQLLQRKITPVDTGCLTEIYRVYPNDCFVIYPNQIMADVTTGEISSPISIKTVNQCYHWDVSEFHFDTFQKQKIQRGIRLFLLPCAYKLPNEQLLNLLLELKKLPKWYQITTDDTVSIHGKIQIKFLPYIKIKNAISLGEGYVVFFSEICGNSEHRIYI